MFLKISQNSQENTCASLPFNEVLKRDYDTGVFLWILRNFCATFFTEHIWATASEVKNKIWHGQNEKRIQAESHNYWPGGLVVIHVISDWRFDLY